jgi:hypothetical protein
MATLGIASDSAVRLAGAPLALRAYFRTETYVYLGFTRSAQAATCADRTQAT